MAISSERGYAKPRQAGDGSGGFHHPPAPPCCAQLQTFTPFTTIFCGSKPGVFDEKAGGASLDAARSDTWKELYACPLSSQ
jgi:hypothetical protein